MGLDIAHGLYSAEMAFVSATTVGTDQSGNRTHIFLKRQFNRRERKVHISEDKIINHREDM
jgi:hypothetical protein